MMDELTQRIMTMPICLRIARTNGKICLSFSHTDPADLNQPLNKELRGWLLSLESRWRYPAKFVT